MCIRDRYRTSISLSVSPPAAVSATSTNLLYRLTRQQQQTVEPSKHCDLSALPPRLSDVLASSNSHDDDDNDHVNDEDADSGVTLRGSDTHSDDVRTGDDNGPAKHGDVVKSDEINTSYVTAATGLRFADTPINSASNMSRTAVNDNQRQSPATNNSVEQQRSRRGDDTVRCLYVLTNTRQADDDPANCQENTKHIALVGARRPVTSSDAGVCHGDADETPQQAVTTNESYVRQTRLDRPGHCAMTSYSVTSSHVTPRRPISVDDDSPVTSRVSVLAVQVGGSTQSAMAGPSVDHSRETLRTDSTRAAIMPHKTTSSRSASTSGPQKESVDMPAVRDGGHCRPLGDSADECLEHVELVVTKTGLTLGFSIDGGNDDRPITVKKVFGGKY